MRVRTDSKNLGAPFLNPTQQVALIDQADRAGDLRLGPLMKNPLRLVKRDAAKELSMSSGHYLLLLQKRCCSNSQNPLTSLKFTFAKLRSNDVI